MKFKLCILATLIERGACQRDTAKYEYQMLVLDGDQSRSAPVIANYFIVIHFVSLKLTIFLLTNKGNTEYFKPERYFNVYKLAS